MPVAYGLIDPRDIAIPHLPDRFIGSRIAHISDIHAWRPSHKWTRVANQLSGLRLDLVLYTGDYDYDHHEPDHAFAALKQFTDHLRPTLGSFGVFGNHDGEALRQLARGLPVTWLTNEAVRLDDAPLEILGLDCDRPPTEDAVKLLLHRTTQPQPARDRPLRLGLAHVPQFIMTVADLGCDLLLSGHTHGGQCRLPWGQPLVNCTALPLRLTSGLLRHRDTLAAVSRGCGSGPFPPRLFCKPHVPVYTLRKGPMPGRRTDGIDNVMPW